jgi:hypothetical protein
MEADADQQDAPRGWQATFPNQHTLQRYTSRSEDAAWMFWYESTIFQPLTGDFEEGAKLKFGGYLYTPSDDALRRGTKNGQIRLVFYDDAEQGEEIGRSIARPIIAADSAQDTWIKSTGYALIPNGTERIEFTVACENGDSGDGAFFVDDVFLELVE